MSDPTPKRYDESGFIDRRDADSGAGGSIPRSQSDAVFSFSGDSGQANIGHPRTRHRSITQLERVYAGNLQSLLYN